MPRGPFPIVPISIGTVYKQGGELVKTTKCLAAWVICLATVSLAYGEEKRWSDQAEISFVDTGGNTDVTTLSGKNVLEYKFTNRLQGAWKVSALYGEDDGERNAESYLAELRLDYLLRKRLYTFATAGWSKDQFAGIDSRYYVGPGVGYKFITGPKHFLVGEAGLTYVNEEYTDNTDRDYIGGRAFGKYEYVLSDKNKFFQSLEFLYDFEESDNYNINSETALIVGLSNSLSLKTSYVIKFDNEPVPSTLKETDTMLSVTLIVNF